MAYSSMKVTENFVAIPPYISTPWDHVMTLHSKGSMLLFHLKNGDTISVPAVSKEQIETIFRFHSQYLEKKIQPSAPIPDFLKTSLNPQDVAHFMEHNLEFQDAPNLPQEILDRLRHLLKNVFPPNFDLFPKAEPHCNCPHCQIARTLEEQPLTPLETEDEKEQLVEEQDLSFSQYTIEPQSDSLFKVSDTLDPSHTYIVHLKDPIGCTCGKTDCEHLIAVLKS